MSDRGKTEVAAEGWEEKGHVVGAWLSDGSEKLGVKWSRRARLGAGHTGILCTSFHPSTFLSFLKLLSNKKVFTVE